MVANHLPDQTHFPATTLYNWGAAMPSPTHFGTGFGLGFQVRLEAGRNPLPGSVGDLTWMGVWGTSFVIDPKGKLKKKLSFQLLNVEPALKPNLSSNSYA